MNNRREKRETRSSLKTKPEKAKRETIIPEIDVDERENVEIEPEIVKPAGLFSETDDVSGKDLYKNQETFKRGSMLDKAIACKSTPNNFSDSNPTIRTKLLPLRKSYSTEKTGFTSDESESKSEGSEFVPEDADSEEMEEDCEDTDETSGEEEVSEDEVEEKKNRATLQKQKLLSEKHTPSSYSAKKISHQKPTYKDLNLKTDEYFETQSEKTLTSNHTLGRLKTPKLDKEKIDELLENQMHISGAHLRGIRRLEENNKSGFLLWLFLLEEGFSVLLHGLGSKRNLIHDFHEKIIHGRPTLIVNGFFPSLTLKEVLDGILRDLMNLEPPSNLNDCMDLIEKTLKEHPDDRIYLLVHNIDGPMLRSSKVQDKLSYLASFSNLHLIASVDHINASLLWDNAKRSRYNFYWCNVTTFLPYKEETSYENSLMVRQSGALALSSLHNVFLSLPDKSRSVYLILVKYQIENAGSYYPGMAFKDLCQRAREGFFVTNDVTLRAQLTEFLDHKLVKMKRNNDGFEYLNIPLDKALLKQFLEQQEESGH